MKSLIEKPERKKPERIINPEETRKVLDGVRDGARDALAKALRRKP
ncbi:MAG: hypothetical protein ACD_65C00266G0003 [uncultured bacterium]|nr:MAG: hypothetical protein ACD_65C00266G0003 [uncultured bacterium]